MFISDQQARNSQNYIQLSDKMFFNARSTLELVYVILYLRLFRNSELYADRVHFGIFYSMEPEESGRYLTHLVGKYLIQRTCRS